MIYVQHLLGVGHLQRARWLARALVRQGFRVALACGGKPPAEWPETDVTLHQLAPVYCPDASFSRLLDVDGNDIDQRWRESRCRQLLDLFERLAPRVLITETFPFGRRMMRFELLPLLEQAQQRRHSMLVLASIRDILQPKSKAGRNQETCDLVEKYYDHVLVHGDPKIATLADSFDAAGRIEKRLFYSGYVCATQPKIEPADAVAAEVLVSAGGSDTGIGIFETAIKARPLSRLRDHHWRLLVSTAVDDTLFADLQRAAGDGISVERNRADFTALMQNARLSISQAGYNTITDLLQTRAAAVVIPFDQFNEVEQSLRAERLRRCGRVAVLEARNLNAENMARAADHALTLDTSLRVNLDGAAKTAMQIRAWLKARAL